ncbi:MAG: ABC transporter permease subunit [Tissierellaceae bacterium]
MKGFISKDRLQALISIALTIVVLAFLSRAIDNEIIFPSIGSIGRSIVGIVREASFLKILASSLYRSLLGFMVSLALAILMAGLSSIYRPINYLIRPLIGFLNSTPIIAIILLALIWLDNELVPMFVGFIMVFPILYERVLKSIANIDEKMMEMARIYKVGEIHIIKDIYMPSIYFGLVDILPSSLGLNLKMVISGEVLSQPQYAIGSRLQLQKIYLNTSGVFAWIVIILILAKLLEYLMRGLVRWIRLGK